MVAVNVIPEAVVVWQALSHDLVIRKEAPNFLSVIAVVQMKDCILIGLGKYKSRYPGGTLRYNKRVYSLTAALGQYRGKRPIIRHHVGLVKIQAGIAGLVNPPKPFLDI